MKLPALPLLKFLRALRRGVTLAFLALGVAAAWGSETWLLGACAVLGVGALLVIAIGLSLFFRPRKSQP